MKITLRQLEVFVMIAKHGNMSRAAEDLYLSQSACSMALTTLEDQLGGELFDRHHKKLILNENGRRVFAEAANIMTQTQELQNVMKIKGNQSLAGNIKVGASTTIGNYILPNMIVKFMNLHEQTKIHLNVNNTAQVVHQLLNFDIDVGFIEGNCNNPEIDVIPWQKDELIVIAAPTHALARKKKISLEALKREKWIFREAGSGTREMLEKAMNKSISPYIELGQTEAIKQAVEAGMGISCLSKASVLKNLKRREIVEIKTAPFPLQRDFYMILHKQKYKSPLLNALIDFTFIKATD